MVLVRTLAAAALFASLTFAPVIAAQSHPTPAPEPVDINRATLEQLKSLPGMGDAYARRVIAGRPYRSKNQLVQRGILPDEAYQKIKDHIVAHRLLR